MASKIDFPNIVYSLQFPSESDAMTLKTTAIPDAQNTPARRVNLHSSTKYIVTTSWNDIVVVRAAIINNIKNIEAHNMLIGSVLNIAGRVSNTNAGPAPGLIPALNAAGKIIRPESIATIVSSSDTCKTVPLKFASFGTYEPYAISAPSPIDSEKNA